MLTQCPSCETVFRVTTAILKMGHGQVRCGKCRTQFDAIECMLDDEDEPIDLGSDDGDEPGGQRAGAQDEIPQDDGIVAREPDFEEDVTLEGSRIEISGTYRLPDAPLPGKAKRVLHEHTVIDRDAAQAIDVDDMNDGRIEETVLDPALDDDEPISDAAGHLLQDVQPGSSASPAISQRLWRRHRAAQEAKLRDNASNEIAAELHALATDTTPRAEHTRRWVLISIVFVLALALQVVNHYRDALIRHAQWGTTFTRLYRAIGVSPRWDLTAYEVQQWGMTGNPLVSDLLRVRAGVINTAPFAQPYPHIKLSMEDRFGGPAGERIFKPTEYLPGDATGTDRLLGPKQRANIEILIVDPGSDAVSFHLNPCLEYEQGMACRPE